MQLLLSVHDYLTCSIWVCQFLRVIKTLEQKHRHTHTPPWEWGIQLVLWWGGKNPCCLTSPSSHVKFYFVQQLVSVPLLSFCYLFAQVAMFRLISSSFVKCTKLVHTYVIVSKTCAAPSTANCWFCFRFWKNRQKRRQLFFDRPVIKLGHTHFLVVVVSKKTLISKWPSRDLCTVCQLPLS